MPPFLLFNNVDFSRDACALVNDDTFVVCSVISLSVLLYHS